MAMFCDFIGTKNITLILKSEYGENQPKMLVYFGIKHLFSGFEFNFCLFCVLVYIWIMDGLEANIYIIRPNFDKIMKKSLKLALFTCIFISKRPLFFPKKKSFYQFIGSRDFLHHCAFVEI